jgi:FkbM family methyltransferase
MNPFSLIRLPLNVRLERLLMRVPLLRRYARRIASSQIIPAVGAVRYGRDRVIVFNGRNSQFHALYDALYHAGYELETCVLLYTLLRGTGTFIDAGSNWGYFALFASALPAFTGGCVCYEPSVATFADLRQCIAQAGLEQRVVAKRLGLGAAVGQLYLDESHELSGLTKLSASGRGDQVQVTTIDAESLADVALIKIDVEGMELAVLQGAAQTIQTQRPWLIVENFLHHDSPEKTLEPIRWMQQQGYVVLMPAACVQHGGTCVPHHYSSPPPLRSEDVDWTRMQFLRVTEANRFLLPHQLNLFGCPQGKLSALSGEVIA